MFPTMHRAARAALASPLLPAGATGVLVVILMIALGAKKAVAAVLGVAFLVALVEWPIIGVVLVILSGTCFQVLGSEGVTGLPASIGKMAGMLTMAAWLYQSMRNRINWTYSPQLVALMLFVAAMAINAVLVRPLHPAGENGFVRFLQAFVVFWLIANIAGQSRQLLLIAVASLTGGLAICGIIGTLEHFVPSLTIDFDDEGLIFGTIGAIIDRDSLDGVALLRITGGLGDSNWLAATLAVVIPLNLFWWWKSPSLWSRALVIGITGLQMLALVLSYTRAGFLGLGVAILFLVWRRVIAPQMLIWGGIAAVLFGLVWLPPGFMDRVLSVKYLQEGSTPVRKELTGTALRFALERPILGYGYGQFGVEFVDRLNTNTDTTVGAYGFELARAVEEGREQARNIGSHNLVLEVMVEYGLVGLLPFLAFILLAFRDLRLAARWGDSEQRLLALCLAAGLVAMCVCGMFIHAKYLKALWFITGLAAAQRRVILTEYWRPDPAAAAPRHARRSTIRATRPAA